MKDSLVERQVGKLTDMAQSGRCGILQEFRGVMSTLDLGGQEKLPGK